MKIVPCTEQQHSVSVLALLNHAIINSTAIYDYVPRLPESMAAWFQTKRTNGFPVIGMEDGNGRLLGFATYGTFRHWPAYKYTVEHSIYVSHEQRRKGLGRQLLEMLIIRAKAQSIHTMIGGIDLENTASIALHASLGFTHAGTVHQVGFKFGRWLDLALFQKILDSPACPTDN